MTVKHDDIFDLKKINLLEVGVEYLCNEVIPLYTDEILADPRTGLINAIDDFLSNESPVKTDKDYITWGDALKQWNV